jgi:multicomponent K+:H+ antiporter subunit E
MTRLLPHPLLSASLFVLWLLLNQSHSTGHLVLGAAAALVGGWTFAALQPIKARPRRLTAIFGLIATVLRDSAVSNVAVALIILGAGQRERSSGFVEIPLELRDPYGLAALACIITSIPGTIWVDLDRTSGILTIHVLDLHDESEWVDTVKRRYERRLLEIFA